MNRLNSKQWRFREEKKEFDFNNIPKVHDLVNRTAEIIAQDVKQGVAKGEDLSGSSFEPLKPATIRAKRRSRGNKSASPTPKKPLMDTHRMVGKGGGTGGVYVKKKASRSSLKAHVGMPKNREKIGIYHNEGAGDLPVREWWGVSDRVEKRLNVMIREWFRLLYKVKGR